METLKSDTLSAAVVKATLSDEIRAGDTVFFDTARRPLLGEFVVIALPSGSTRILVHDSIPGNRRILGTVVAVIRPAGRGPSNN